MPSWIRSERASVAIFQAQIKAKASDEGRQAHGELAAAAGAVAAGLDAPAVHRDQPPHQAQADAQPALRPLQ